MVEPDAPPPSSRPVRYVRRLEPFDLPLLAALHAASFERPWGNADLAQILALPGSVGLLAEIDGAPAGFVLAVATAPEAEIVSFGVAPSWRRCGIGRALMARLLDALAAVGIARVVLEVADDNAAALALYGALSFVEVGRRPNYYRRANGPPAPALILARTLSGGGSRPAAD